MTAMTRARTARRRAKVRASRCRSKGMTAAIRGSSSLHRPEIGNYCRLRAEIAGQAPVGERRGPVIWTIRSAPGCSATSMCCTGPPETGSPSA